jgi:hypothetical protein
LEIVFARVCFGLSSANMRIVSIMALAVSLIAGRAVEVLQVSWPTAHAAQPSQLDPAVADYLPAMRLAVQALPESAIVSMALGQPALLGLTREEGRRLQQLTAERYRLMARSPHFANVPSALPYCFSDRKPASGLATVYVPDRVGTNTPTIVFVHGDGGSFLWYQHYASEIFPNHIIICPAYGISPLTIPQAYIAECAGAVSKRLKIRIATPALVGLSSGGFGACRLYTAAPKFYSQMVCLGAYPTDDTIERFTRDARPRFLSGGTEPFASSGDFQRRIERIRRTCSGVEGATIPGADHFFMLTHQQQTVSYLRKWIPSASQLKKAAAPPPKKSNEPARQTRTLPVAR